MADTLSFIVGCDVLGKENEQLKSEVERLRADLQCVRSTLAADYRAFGVERAKLEAEIKRLRAIVEGHHFCANERQGHCYGFKAAEAAGGVV